MVILDWMDLQIFSCQTSNVKPLLYINKDLKVRKYDVAGKKKKCFANTTLESTFP